MSVEKKSVDKFAFIGSASVGKTTMMEILRARFMGNRKVAFIDEAAKIFFESQMQVKGGFVEIQEQLQDFVLQREKASLKPGVELIIADRSVIDPIVYTQIYDTEANAKKLLQRVAHWFPTYTLLILLNPSGVPDDPRPARLESSEQRIAIHDKFGEFCIKNNLPYVEISGPLNDRANKVEKVIFDNTLNKRALTSRQ